MNNICTFVILKISLNTYLLKKTSYLFSYHKSKRLAIEKNKSRDLL